MLSEPIRNLLQEEDMAVQRECLRKIRKKEGPMAFSIALMSSEFCSLVLDEMRNVHKLIPTARLVSSNIIMWHNLHQSGIYESQFGYTWIRRVNARAYRNGGTGDAAYPARSPTRADLHALICGIESPIPRATHHFPLRYTTPQQPAQKIPAR